MEGRRGWNNIHGFDSALKTFCTKEKIWGYLRCA